MTRPSFLALNEAMALRALIDALQEVEQSWDLEPNKQESLARLLERLTWAKDHRSALVSQQSSLLHRIPKDPSYHQFMSLVTPLERAHGRGVSDGEMKVKTDDRSEILAPKIPLVLVVDNLRSAFNVGSIFRTAECFGASHLYLCGYTAKPDQDKLKKAAMGTETLVSWSWHARAEELLDSLREEGYRSYALETSEGADQLGKHEFPPVKTALVFGNERYGVEASLLKKCDGILEIPCQGQKNSLNVALSLGIALYEWRRQYLIKTERNG